MNERKPLSPAERVRLLVAQLRNAGHDAEVLWSALATVANELAEDLGEVYHALIDEASGDTPPTLPGSEAPRDEIDQPITKDD